MKDLIEKLGGVITEDYTKESLIIGGLYIHWIYFEINGIEFIFSEDKVSYVLSYWNAENKEIILYQGVDILECEKALKDFVGGK